MQQHPDESWSKLQTTPRWGNARLAPHPEHCSFAGGIDLNSNFWIGLRAEHYPRSDSEHNATEFVAGIRHGKSNPEYCKSKPGYRCAAKLDPGNRTNQSDARDYPDKPDPGDNTDESDSGVNPGSKWSGYDNAWNYAPAGQPNNAAGK